MPTLDQDRCRHPCRTVSLSTGAEQESTAMNIGTRTGLGLLLLAGGLLGACCSSSPSMPSPVPSPAARPGTIELTTNRPDGGTLLVNPCPGETNPIPCTGDLQLRF